MTRLTLALLLLAAPLQGQSVVERTYYECVSQHPCDWAMHAAVPVAGGWAMGELTGTDSRWWAAGVTFGLLVREARQVRRWGIADDGDNLVDALASVVGLAVVVWWSDSDEGER